MKTVVIDAVKDVAIGKSKEFPADTSLIVSSNPLSFPTSSPTLPPPVKPSRKPSHPLNDKSAETTLQGDYYHSFAS